MVREEQETPTVDPRDEEKMLEDVWVAEAKEYVCPARRLPVTGHLPCSKSVYSQLRGNPKILQVVIGWWENDVASWQFKGTR